MLRDSLFAQNSFASSHFKMPVVQRLIDEGLVDFPALRHGETVLLCWMLGEDHVAHWHTIEDGFAGRRPLPLDG